VLSAPGFCCSSLFQQNQLILPLLHVQNLQEMNASDSPRIVRRLRVLTKASGSDTVSEPEARWNYGCEQLVSLGAERSGS
jgi:hypothetical protein